MTDFLDRLQRKPEKEKRKITIGISLLITLIIFGLWLASLTLDLSFKTEESPPETVSGPLVGFKTDFVSGIEEIGRIIRNLF